MTGLCAEEPLPWKNPGQRRKALAEMPDVQSRVCALMDVTGRNLVGPSEPCTQRTHNQGLSPQRSQRRWIGEERKSRDQPNKTRSRKKTLRGNLTTQVNRPSRGPDDGNGREIMRDHRSLGDGCGWVRVERTVRAAMTMVTPRAHRMLGLGLECT